MNMANKVAEILEDLLSALELPPSAYEKAKSRYEDLGSWLLSDSSGVGKYDPHIFSQGSFRLGTAIRPLNAEEFYDLDLTCKLQEGISKDVQTQAEVKSLLGLALERYRTTRKILNPLEEKHRCWRINYKDDLSFHMDVVPCIPADKERKGKVFSQMTEKGLDRGFSGRLSELTVSITDSRHPGYRSITDDWKISNPEGYALWFESRMALSDRSRSLLEKALVDDLPTYSRRTPLQLAIQILKRHRDQMFLEDDDSKPISIIITTLAGHAYEGETVLQDALFGILSRMRSYVNSSKPRIPNPVDPGEDFADKWSMPKYAHLRLEENFYRWLDQATMDFTSLVKTSDVKLLERQYKESFGIRRDFNHLDALLGGGALALNVAKAPTVTIEKAPSPWLAS